MFWANKIEQFDIPLKDLPFSQHLNMIRPVFTQKMSLLRSWPRVYICHKLTNKAADRNIFKRHSCNIVRRSLNNVFGSHRFAICNNKLIMCMNN